MPLRPLHISSVVRAVLLFGALSGGASAPGAALADSTPAATPPGHLRGKSPEIQAQILYMEAQTLRKAGDLRGALAKLEEAYQVLPTPALLWPLAELRLELSQPVEGLDALRRYRQEVAPSDMEQGQQEGDAQKLEGKLREKLAYLRPRARAGATILVDGREVGRAPLADKVMVNPGSHRVNASDGSATVETVVEVQPGQEAAVALDESAPRRGYFPHPVTWAAIGLTTGFLLTTTVLGSVAIAETRDLSGRCPDGLCVGSTSQDIMLLNSEVSAQRTHAVAASAVLGVTSFLAVGTAALILFDWHRQKAGRTLLSLQESRPRLGPLAPVLAVTRDGAGFALGGRF